MMKYIIQIHISVKRIRNMEMRENPIRQRQNLLPFFTLTNKACNASCAVFSMTTNVKKQIRLHREDILDLALRRQNNH